jgi:hypothetical protein
LLHVVPDALAIEDGRSGARTMQLGAASSAGGANQLAGKVSLARGGAPQRQSEN